MKTVCGYIRVSTDSQTELSPASQHKLIKEYCQKNGYILADVFEDLGISGKSADHRPAFRQMIALCKAKDHPYDAIIVWKFSRFARNQEESIVYKSMLRKIGVDVISISEPISEGLGGKLTEAILEIMDEYYSINLAQEVKRGMAEGARQGKIMSIAPLGYKLVNRQYVPDEYAPIIQEIFNSFLAGEGMATIAYNLNQRGYRTRRGAKFENRIIKYILQNPAYIGKIRWNYTGRKRKVKDSSEWIIVDGTHEPIIDTATYNKAQERIATLCQPIANRRLPSKHWLSGLLVCAKCGGGMSYHRADEKKHTAPYFVCQNRTRGKCSGQSTKAEWVERDFFDGLSQAVLSGNYVKKQRTAPTDYYSDELEKQLAGIDKKLERIKEAYRNGIDTLDEYKANKAIIENERNILSERIKKSLSKPVAQPQEHTSETISSVIDMLKSPDNSVQHKSEALRTVLDKVVYSKEADTMDFYFLG